jgi:hypothetical protein
MIKGVSEIRRLPRLGKIYLGDKEQGDKGPYPRATDHFVIKDLPEVVAVYGKKPKELDIMFPVNDLEIVFPQWYKRYGKSGLLCRGDGETAEMVDKDTGEIKKIPCPGMECTWFQQKHCRYLAHLQFLLPKVSILGVYQIDTSSYHSIININSTLQLLRAVTGGRIAMIPLKLALRPKEVHPPGIKKKIVYVMELHGDINIDKLKLLSDLKKQPIYSLPSINEDERPKDLYPDELYSANTISETETQPSQQTVQKQQPMQAAQGNVQSKNGNARTAYLVRLVANPVRPVNVMGVSTWTLEVERNTKTGLVRGRLLIPADRVEPGIIDGLKVGSKIIAISGEPVEIRNNGFLIRALEVRIDDRKSAAS